MANLQIYNYNGNKIAFDFTDTSQMVNATEMAAMFGKNPYNFLRTKDAKAYIKAIRDRYVNLRNENIVNVIQGGFHQGTWMHQKLALRYAQKLNPKFALWVDERITELMQTGKTELKPKTDDEIILASLNILNKRLADAKQQLELKEAVIQEQAPIVKYAKDVLSSEDTITATQLAKQLGFKSAISFNKWLHQNGIIFKQSGQWVLYSRYADKNLTKVNVHNFTYKDGTEGTSHSTVWTEKGVNFCWNLLNNGAKKARKSLKKQSKILKIS